MEASALQAPATLPHTRVAIGTPLLRFRSDEQLVALFRAGHDEAFRVIHERYHKRLFAYARQMLAGRQDAEDALQDVYVRAYAGLRASNQDLALKAWLFRVAHNRCVDELRRPAPPPPEVLQLVRTPVHDPLAEVDLREALRRLIEDIRRLPDQQRSALLMRELAGMSYADLSASLGISVGAVKSLLVRARVALAQAAEARDTSCLVIREQLVEAHDQGVRPNANARKHMRDCVGCKSFRRELRGMSRQLAAVTPAVGPLGVLAKTLGFSGGAGGGGGGLALLGGGGASAGGLAVGVNHVATLLVAAMATAGGAVEIQHTIIAPPHHASRAAMVIKHQRESVSRVSAGTPSAIATIAHDVQATVSTAPKLAASVDLPAAPHLPANLGQDAGGPVHAPPMSAAALGKSPAGSTRKTAVTTTSTAAAGSTCVDSTSSASASSGSAQTATASSTGAPPATAQATPAAQTSCGESSTPSAGTSSTSTSQPPSSSGQSTGVSGTTMTGSGTTSGEPDSSSTGTGSAGTSGTGSATGTASTAK